MCRRRALPSETWQSRPSVTISKLWRQPYVSRVLANVHTRVEDILATGEPTRGGETFGGTNGDLGFAEEHLSVAVALVPVTFSASFPNGLWRASPASWAVPRLPCVLARGSAAIWPWNDLRSCFSFSNPMLPLWLVLGWYALQSIVFRVGGRKMHCRGEQARLFP